MTWRIILTRRSAISKYATPNLKFIGTLLHEDHVAGLQLFIVVLTYKQQYLIFAISTP